MSDYDSDNSSSSEPIDYIEQYMLNCNDEIIDLYYDLKSRFPYMFGESSIIIHDIIMEQLHEGLDKKYKIIYSNKFYGDYYYEISVSLNVINNYLKRNKIPLIPLYKWANLCYTSNCNKNNCF